jgi:hypothetical protein
LTITGLNHITKDLKVNVTYQSLAGANIDPKSIEYLPTLMIESYGKIAELKRAEAIGFHQGTEKAISADVKAKPYNINKSYKLY